MVRDDEGAMMLAASRGVVVPPIFEEIRKPSGTEFRRMAMGWRVADPETGESRGYVILFASHDGEDWEIMADGGWTLREARALFRFIFDISEQPRVSARCRAVNFKNLAALQRMGFRIEGRKRLADGDVILLGMLRGECRFLREGNAHGHLQDAEAA